MTHGNQSKYFNQLDWLQPLAKTKELQYVRVSIVTDLLVWNTTF